MPSKLNTGAPLLVLLAHPDDEFGVFPWIEEAICQGRPVHCVWMTDGGWGGQDIMRRQNESEKVLLRMGLPKEAMNFLGSQLAIADGDLLNQLHTALAGLRSACEALQPSHILLPAWEGGHQDHDALHLIGLAFAAEKSALAYEYSLYQGRGLPGPLFRVLSLMVRNDDRLTIPVTLYDRVRYVLTCLSFRSQWKSFVGLLPFYALRLFSTRYPFVLQAAESRMTSTRPHPGPLLYERRGGPSWSVFADRSAAYRNRLAE